MKNKSLKVWCLLIILLWLCILSVVNSPGQTNAAPQPPPYPSSAPQDIERVLNDFGVQNISVPTIGGLLFIAYAAVKILRNKTSLGNGQIGQFLGSVLNFENKANLPSVPPAQIPPAVPQPQQPVKP